LYAKNLLSEGKKEIDTSQQGKRVEDLIGAKTLRDKEEITKNSPGGLNSRLPIAPEAWRTMEIVLDFLRGLKILI